MEISTESKSTMDKLLELMPLEDIDHGVHVSPDLGFMYIETPKCACTTLKFLTQSATYQKKGLAIPEFDSFLIHDENRSPMTPLKNLSREAQERVLTSPEFFRFGFVRNPYNRVLSCYLTGIVNRMPRKPLILSYFEGIPVEELPADVLENKHLSFKEFLLAASRQPPRMMDIHWRPMNQLLATSVLSYHFLGRFENLMEDIAWLRQRLFPDLTVSVPNALWPTNSKNLFWEYYDDEALALAAQIYKRDFEEFGYDTHVARP